MRIGLNLLHVQPGIGGAWNYIARLVGILGGEDDHNTYVCFVTRRSIDIVPIDKRNIEIVLVNIDPESRWQRVLYENTALPFQTRQYGLDVVHWFAATQALYSGARNVVSVYDLQVFENPKSFSRTKRLYLQYMMAYTARKADLLLPMSRTTAQQLHSILAALEHRMVIIRAVIGDHFRRASEEKIAELRVKYNLPDHFWLYVAHFYPHKNHLRLIEAYYTLKSTGAEPWPLVLRGDDHGVWPDAVRLIDQLGLSQDVIFLPRLAEAELPALYSAATAVVFPSLYEGGAIPVVEAMACDCPVIASSLPLLMEYESGIDAYFDPHNTNAMADAMRSFQFDHCDPKKLERRKIWDAREHRPAHVAAQLQRAYELAGDSK